MPTYHLDTPLQFVKGVGPVLADRLAKHELLTVQDVLIYLPFRYEDRRTLKTVTQLQTGESDPKEIFTTKGIFSGLRSSYRGRRSFQSAWLSDETGRIKIFWFNSPHVATTLKPNQEYFVSGKLNKQGTLTQPTVEAVKAETLHTNRLVPMYSSIPALAPGMVRRIVKEILDNLEVPPDPLSTIPTEGTGLLTPLPLIEAFRATHFPEQESLVVAGRERLALEELLSLMKHSAALKKEWQVTARAPKLVNLPTLQTTLNEHALPFTLTGAQHRCLTEIFDDLQQPHPMNRLLIGDVGSGKTAVAGYAAIALLRAGQHVVFVAPTQLLAEQHAETLHHLFPTMPCVLVTSHNKLKEIPSEPTLFIGTHAVLLRLEKIKPGLVIYDEQHRFGVAHRSLIQELTTQPHVLSLTATPIPRTLTLTLFSHLAVSVIDEMPPGRQLVQTWLVSRAKRPAAGEWIVERLLRTSENNQCFIVCPFIDPSNNETLSTVAAATELFATISKDWQQTAKKLQKANRALRQTPLRLAVLHGRMSKTEQAAIAQQLYTHELDAVVTTPIVEVGMDVPNATIMVIEAAERFGLASLHQLRGRVGRRGQTASCLLFTTTPTAQNQQRLKAFCQIHNGQQLAELDLQQRGAGDIFGFEQHGFDDLRFASWANLELVTTANQIFQQLEKTNPGWHPALFSSFIHEKNRAVLAN